MTIPASIRDAVAQHFGDAALNARLAAADMDEAEPLLRAELKSIDPKLTLVSCGEKPRGMLREIELIWSLEGEEHRQVLVLEPTSA